MLAVLAFLAVLLAVLLAVAAAFIVARDVLVVSARLAPAFVVASLFGVAVLCLVL